MSKRTLAIVLVMTILASIFVVSTTMITSGSTIPIPSKIDLYVCPSTVPADNNAYNCIFVQLLDSNGKPARAQSDTTISLASETTSVGTVDSTIAITKGETFGSANFYSTLSSGTSKITASATGYSTVEASIKTITPIPSAIAVYGFPSTLPADGAKYPAIMVQLQDSQGNPQRAPIGGVEVILSSSRTQHRNSRSSSYYSSGETYAIANFTTTMTPSTTPTQVWSAANGYTSKYVEITTKPVTTTPSAIKIFVGPPKILADNKSYPQVAVQLQDSSGNISRAISNITLSFTSWDPNIVKVVENITIGPDSQFSTYGIIALNTTYKAGQTTIIALKDNGGLNPGQAVITTVEFIPPKLAVFVVPEKLPADAETYSAIQVQLQDSKGNPGKNLEGDVTVSLFSQDPTIATVSPTVVIPQGKTQATATLTVTNSEGSTLITAQTTGYSTGQGTVATNFIDFAPLEISISSNTTNVNSGKATAISAQIASDGAAVTGATVTFTSSIGGSFSAQQVGNGYYNTNFTAPSVSQTTACTITVTATKNGYVDNQATTQISISPTQAATPTPTATPASGTTPTPTPTAGTNSSANLQFFIKDSYGNPLNGTIVQSITQPAGVNSLFDISDDQGSVTFKEIPSGSYTFTIVKQGYDPMNATLDLTGQPMSLPLTLLTGAEQETNQSLLLPIAAIVIVAVGVSLLVVFLLIRRRGKNRIQQLQELQRQLRQG